jgi:mycothione reductase
MSTAAHYDLIILGTGSGNSIVGPAMDNWRVAIVEEGVFGGTCLNRGCIPTKMLVHAADTAETIRHAAHLGIDAHVDQVRWRDIRDRVFDRIDPIAAGGERYRTSEQPNVTVVKGHGHFSGAKEITVVAADGRQTVISGDRIVIAVGGRPTVPELPGLVETGFHTSDDIMRVDEVPEHLIVLGGGFIACEMAHVFGAFGSKVTIVQRRDRLMMAEDSEISAAITEAFSARFDLRLGQQVVAVRRIDSRHVEVDLGDGTVINGSNVLVSVGRRTNTDQISPELSGIAVTNDGRIAVDEYQRTSVDGVWALGDVSSPHLLKHVANHEARVVAHNVLNPNDLIATDHRFVPHAVFTRPQIASVGMTESEARAAGHKVMTTVQYYGDVAYGWAMEDTTSFCKLVADRKSRLLLGAHIIGPHASSLIQQLIQGMTFGRTVDEMGRGQYYIHPALPELIENALLQFPKRQ